jgi:hypothetical protein
MHTTTFQPARSDDQPTRSGGPDCNLDCAPSMGAVSPEAMDLLMLARSVTNTLYANYRMYEQISDTLLNGCVAMTTMNVASDVFASTEPFLNQLARRINDCDATIHSPVLAWRIPAALLDMADAMERNGFSTGIHAMRRLANALKYGRDAQTGGAA